MIVRSVLHICKFRIAYYIAFYLYCLLDCCALHLARVCTVCRFLLVCAKYENCTASIVAKQFFLQKIPQRAVRYLRLKKKGILQVVLGNGHLQPAKYRVGVDGRLCLQKGWKEFVIDSGLKSEQVVVLNFFELEDRTVRITFDVIG